MPIADLVLWIGFLKWQIRTAGVGSIKEPILHAYGNIREQDAVIAYDRQELLRDAGGKPLSRWDGVTRKLHPVTGEEVPDPDATVPLYSYVNPKRAPWPETEFVVGNPPFIGGKDMRAELGDGYAEACWKARPQVPGGADFVMHFWDEAATRLTAKAPKGKQNPLRRFGFITTNSITQTFSRRVIEKHMAAKEPLSLVYAVPDHPWLKASGKAAVRIAMTVAVAGEREGVLADVVSEEGLNTDTPLVTLESREGKIRENISIGVDISARIALSANSVLGFKGYMPWGTGFIVSGDSAPAQELRSKNGAKHLLRYFNGRDIVQRPRGIFALDFYQLPLSQLQSAYPVSYQHLLTAVKPERDLAEREAYRLNWWVFAEARTGMRASLNGLNRFVATAETARHRLFLFLEQMDAPDQKVRVVATSDAAVLSVLSSRLHIYFALLTGGFLEDRPAYQHSDCFDPFPFPLAVDPTLAPADPLFARQARLRELGERLDAFRKERLKEHAFLTMTGLYNALERLRELENGVGAPLSEAERDVHQAGLISVLKEIHDDIDRATFAAYGWNDLIPELVGKPGATLPSPHKSDAQERAEEELLSRLVALNQERAAEEKRGLVRWLRPDYQVPKLGAKAPKPAEEQAALDVVVPEPAAGKPKWPADGLEQIRLVRDLLAKAPAPTPSEAIAGVFDGKATAKRRDRVAEVLETLVATGAARTGDHDGQRRYFLPR